MAAGSSTWKHMMVVCRYEIDVADGMKWKLWAAEERAPRGVHVALLVLEAWKESSKERYIGDVFCGLDGREQS